MVIRSVAGGTEGNLVGFSVLKEFLCGGVAGLILIDSDHAVIGNCVGNQLEVIQSVLAAIGGIQIAGQQGGPVYQRDHHTIRIRMKHLLPANPSAAAGGVNHGDGSVQFLLQVGHQ